MKTSPLRLLLTALVSGMLFAGTMAVPANANSSSNWRGYGWTAGSPYQTVHYRGRSNRYIGHTGRNYRGYNRSRRHRHNRRRGDDFAIGLGLGVLGAIIAAPHYHGQTYRAPVRHGFCHVHQYRVRGMTFHREVRCFKHRNWRHNSIVYVR